MTSRERVKSALNFRQPDRIPVDFGATAVTGIHASIVAKLREYYGLEKRPVKIHEPFQMLGWVDDDLAAALGVDTVSAMPRGTMFGNLNTAWKPWRTPWGQEVLIAADTEFETVPDGSVAVYPGGDRTVGPSARLTSGGFFFDAIIRQEPFDEDNPSVEDNLEEFAILSDAVIGEIAASCREAVSTGRAVACGGPGTALGDIALVPATQLKAPKGIRDVAEWYMSLLLRPDFVKGVFERQTEIALENLKKLNLAAGKDIDVLFLCGTDFGTQISTFCNAETFRELYLPYYRRMTDYIHAETDWKVFKHSCGAVMPLIDCFIEAGFDILNPVQCSAAGMDPVELKRRFGRKLTFWGGGVDTQKVLPFGTPAEVKHQVLERCRIFGEGGGFVFNTVHNVQAKTPIENLAAMFDAIREFNQKG